MTASTGTSVSVIICTRDRYASLERALQTMLALDLSGVARFELIVVDNRSSDATRSVVDAFEKQAGFAVHYVYEPRPGLSIARNRGLAAANGVIIMFTDDDCFVKHDWVRRAVELLGPDPLQLIGGRVEQYNPDHLEEAVKTGSTREVAVVETVFGFLLGANMIFGRAVVDRIGNFDERFGAGTALRAAEDTDYVYRALVCGVPVLYEPSLAVQHDHGRQGECEHFRLNRNYSIGDGALAMRHLLAGRAALLRPLYWALHRSFNDRATHSLGFRWPLVKLFVFVGALRFLIFASWRRAN